MKKKLKALLKALLDRPHPIYGDATPEDVARAMWRGAAPKRTKKNA